VRKIKVKENCIVTPPVLTVKIKILQKKNIKAEAKRSEKQDE